MIEPPPDASMAGIANPSEVHRSHVDCHDKVPVVDV